MSGEVPQINFRISESTRRPSHTLSSSMADAVALYLNRPLARAREQFLETELVAVTDLTARDSTDCTICSETLNDPVRLPCSELHVYCRACITTWLETENHNTCPECRHVLFKDPRSYIPSLYRRFHDVLEAAHDNHNTYEEEHALLHQWLASLGDHPRVSEVQTVHLPNRSLPDSPLEPTLIVGDGYIDRGRLADGLALITSHVSVLTTESFERWRDWDDLNGQIWEEIMHTVYRVCIAREADTTVGVVQMPSIWLDRVRAELVNGPGRSLFSMVIPETDPVGNDVRYAGMRRDLRVVLEYLAFLAWDEQRFRNQQQRPQRTLSRIGESIRRRLGRSQ